MKRLIHANLHYMGQAVTLLESIDDGLFCKGGPAFHNSSLGRELQFLASHSVHHFAMIGGICRALEAPLPDDFGAAPSTIRHRATCES